MSESAPPPITPERLAEILPLVKQGERRACQEVIRGLMRYAYSIARRHVRFGNLDEMEAQAMLGLCQAVDSCKEKLKDDNIVKYISSTIHWYCSNFYDHCAMVRVPRTTYCRYKRENKSIKIVKTVSGYDVPNCVKFVDTIEQQEVFDSIAKTEREKIFLTMIMEGYADKDVADRCKVSRKTISLLRKVIEERAQRVLQQRVTGESKAPADSSHEGNHDCRGDAAASS